MEGLDTFEVAEEAEELAAELCSILALHFESAPKHSKLFKQVEQEEIQHGMRIKMLRKNYVTERGEGQDISVNVTALQGLLQEGQQLKQRLKSGHRFTSFAEAATAMSVLEDRFAIAHAEMLVAASGSKLEKFFKQLADQDRGHATLLQQSQDEAGKHQPRT